MSVVKNFVRAYFLSCVLNRGILVELNTFEIRNPDCVGCGCGNSWEPTQVDGGLWGTRIEADLMMWIRCG